MFLIDGGETHARAAQTVAWEFGVDVPIFGMVKDDRHRTRALVTPEGREIGIVTQQAVFSSSARSRRRPTALPSPTTTRATAKAPPAPPWTVSQVWARSGGRSRGNTSAPSRPSGRRMWRPLPPWCPGPPPRRCGEHFHPKNENV
ncbi:MAG: hypothetical protein ACLTYN_04945 [Dysosmobacter welbionis]